MVNSTYNFVESYKSVKIYYKQYNLIAGSDIVNSSYCCFFRVPATKYSPVHAHCYSASDIRSVKRYITKFVITKHFIDLEEFIILIKNQKEMEQKENEKTKVQPLKIKKDENTKPNRSAEFQYYGHVLQGLEGMVKVAAGNTTASSQFTEIFAVIREAHEKVISILKKMSDEICDL